MCLDVEAQVEREEEGEETQEGKGTRCRGG